MTREPVAEDVRRLLTDAVPPLPEAGDRLGAIRRRVIRAALRRAAVAGFAVSVLVALAVTVPRLVADQPVRPTPASSLGVDGCPVPGTPPEVFDPDEGTGFRLPGGASEVTLCELVVDAVAARRRDPQAGEARRLSVDVDVVVAALNALPDRGAARGDVPQNQFGGCPSIAYPTELSFVLRYPDREPVVVWLHRACGVAVYAGHPRYRLAEAMTVFFPRYRAQLIAAVDPAVLTAPSCVEQLSPAAVDPTTSEGQQLRDGISRNRDERELFLPSPLHAVSVCRYAISATGGELIAEQRIEALGGVRDAVNAGLSDQAAGTECGTAAAPTPTTLLDQLLVVDETGAVSEIRVIRRPCTAIVVAHRGAMPAPVRLLTALDDTLGPPA